jgi:hypothetical protein
MAMAEPWYCEAYGPRAPKAETLCFIAPGPVPRACASPETCRETMAAERQRVWRRINEMAASGDPDGEFLAGEFTDPAQILGGGDDGQA